MKIPSFNEASLEQLCNVLGDTSTGLTGSEIGRYLEECGIADPNPGMTKRIRLFDALVARQRVDGCANNVCAFIQRVMNPVLHVQSPDYFKAKQGELNRVLSFEGLRLTDEGTLEQCNQARTISDAEAAAGAVTEDDTAEVTVLGPALQQPSTVFPAVTVLADTLHIMAIWR